MARLRPFPRERSARSHHSSSKRNEVTDYTPLRPRAAVSTVFLADAFSKESLFLVLRIQITYRYKELVRSGCYSGDRALIELDIPVRE